MHYAYQGWAAVAPVDTGSRGFACTLGRVCVFFRLKDVRATVEQVEATIPHPSQSTFNE